MQYTFYDLAGQTLGEPVYKLIGAKCRDRVEFAYESPPMPIKATAAEAEKAAKMGFRVYKQSTERYGNIVVETTRLTTKACGPDSQIARCQSTNSHTFELTIYREVA